MRCPDCNKFVSFDTDTDPELSLTVDDEGVVTGTCRIVNTCAECNAELKEAELEVEIDLSATVAEHRGEEPQDKHTLEISTEEAVRTDRTQTTDRHGKRITNRRYMRTYYGAEVTVTVTCSCGEEIGTQSETVEVQASGMEEMV